MRREEHRKIQARHLKRKAYLYVRQSTLQQVAENRESTRRQYALRRRAVALGWAERQVEVIDTDLGQSGAAAQDRAGFQKLVAEVGMGQAGLVMGLEVSRLARNCADWHRLLEICALSETLILDEDGLYDPNAFNDRLLLGMKGTMSEAEWYMIRSRLQGGILSKARRGELRSPLPTGLVYDGQGQVTLDPDRQVRQAVRLVFATFRRLGTVCATCRHFRDQGLLLPRRRPLGAASGQLLWGQPRRHRIARILHNPRYAGAYCYGRRRTRRQADGRSQVRTLPPEEWHALLPGHHPGYISWQEFQENQRRLQRLAPAPGGHPPREGPALLQGLLMCGLCGRRMTVRYCRRPEGAVPDYLCRQPSEPACQQMRGTGLDEAVGKLVVEAVTPLALEVALNVQEELQARLEEADRLRRQQVERARYEAELARRRFFQVDPDNRLVADSLEADWNGKLRALAQARQEYERARKADRLVLDGRRREEILALAADFPRLWQDPKTSCRDRKRMIRLLIEDVTATRQGDRILAQVRFRGGATSALTAPIPLQAWKTWLTPPEVVAQIDRLLEDHTDAQVASILNERGLRSGKGLAFHAKIVWNLRREYQLKSHYERLRGKGMLTLREMSQKLKVAPGTVLKWRKHGIVAGRQANDKKEYLFEPPGPNPPKKQIGVNLALRGAQVQGQA